MLHFLAKASGRLESAQVQSGNWEIQVRFIHLKANERSNYARTICSYQWSADISSSVWQISRNNVCWNCSESHTLFTVSWFSFFFISNFVFKVIVCLPWQAGIIYVRQILAVSPCFSALEQRRLSAIISQNWARYDRIEFGDKETKNF